MNIDIQSLQFKLLKRGQRPLHIFDLIIYSLNHFNCSLTSAIVSSIVIFDLSATLAIKLPSTTAPPFFNTMRAFIHFDCHIKVHPSRPYIIKHIASSSNSFMTERIRSKDVPIPLSSKPPTSIILTSLSSFVNLNL